MTTKPLVQRRVVLGDPFRRVYRPGDVIWWQSKKKGPKLAADLSASPLVVQSDKPAGAPLSRTWRVWPWRRAGRDVRV